MIGGNDVRDAALYQTGSDATDAITAGVETEVHEIKALSSEGAKDFLVVNVPNVGLIPEFAQDNPGTPANATDYSISYDSQLSAGLEGLGLPTGDRLTDFNLFAFNTNILDNAALLRVHEHDASLLHRHAVERGDYDCNAARTARTSRASSIGTTSIRQRGVQALWAEGFRAAIPEPSTWAMLLLGFAGMGFAGYASSRKANAA